MAGTVPVARSLKDIYAEDDLSVQTTRWEKLLQQFKTNYGSSPDFVSRSPGRVNLIGEHVDYSLYPVLPMAITADVLLAVRVIDDTAAPEGHYRIKVSNVQSTKFSSHEFDIPYDTVNIDAKVHEWTNYFKSGLRGAVEHLRQKNGEGYKPKSMEILMDGSVPAGGGLSSSAAFVSASALAVMFANGEKSVNKTALTELAIVSERAVGVNSGGMDQSASVFSVRGSALLVSFVPTLKARPVRFSKTEPEISFVIAQSFVQSDKQVTGPVCYNLRVVECSLAAAYLHAVLNKTSKPLPADSGPLGISLQGFQSTYFSNQKSSLSPEAQLTELIALTKSTLTNEEGYTREEIASTLSCSVSQLNDRFTSTFPIRAERFALRQRALHVFTEALRVLQFLYILEDPSQDPSSRAQSLGDLMNATQASCKDLYECSCPEIDDICSIARRAGSTGSRLTGAGWGGCSVHLVPVDRVDAVKAAWEKEYYSKRDLSKEQRESAVVVSKPGGGSAVLVLGEGGVL
ncbi:hypothetical protein WAI453_003721 [Rhynchosporium graminicola]